MDLFLDVLRVFSLVLIPALVYHLASSIEHWIENKEFRAIPALTILPKIAGTLLAVGLLYTNLGLASFDLEVLFTENSPWKLDFAFFLTERGNLFAYSFRPALLAVMPDPAAGPLLSRPLFVGVIVYLVIMATCTTICFWLWKFTDAVRAILCCGIILLLTAWMTIYFVTLLFWALYMLNFWVLAVIALYYQYRRQRG